MNVISGSGARIEERFCFLVWIFSFCCFPGAYSLSHQKFHGYILVYSAVRSASLSTLRLVDSTVVLKVMKAQNCIFYFLRKKEQPISPSFKILRGFYEKNVSKIEVYSLEIAGFH